MMRDESRIEEMLSVLREIWQKNPDLRLGQIIVNAAATVRVIEPCQQVFYLEDTLMLKGLLRYIELTDGL